MKIHHPLGVPSSRRVVFLPILIRLPRGGLKCCTSSQMRPRRGAHDKFQEVTQKAFIPNPENIYEDIYSHMKDKII
jgi:hypothetical protein